MDSNPIPPFTREERVAAQRIADLLWVVSGVLLIGLIAWSTQPW